MVNGVTGGAGAAQAWRHAGGSGGDDGPTLGPLTSGTWHSLRTVARDIQGKLGCLKGTEAGGGCSAGAGGPCRPPPCSSCPWQAAPWGSCVTLSPLSLACPDLGVTSSTTGRCQSDPPFCSQTAASSLLCIQGHPRMALAARAEEENSPEQTEEHDCFPTCKVSVSPGWGVWTGRPRKHSGERGLSLNLPGLWRNGRASHPAAPNQQRSNVQRATNSNSTSPCSQTPVLLP